MRRLACALALATLASPALAQSAGVGPNPAPYEASPWWMREPIIASTGHVRTELPANRANFFATFQAVERTSPEATRKAADQVRTLGEALRAYGADKVRVATTFSMRPLFDQYRDAEGRIQENRRADQVERYEVNANVQVEVRDVALIERVYATVVAARPTSTGGVSFRLEPDNVTRTEIFGQAVTDAARRARLAVEGAGARLGSVKLIDPTGRACETDVLVSGARRGRGDVMAQDVVVTGSRIRGAPPAPPPPPMELPAAPDQRGGGQQLRPEDMQLPLQPPLQQLTASACVVYALG